MYSTEPWTGRAIQQLAQMRLLLLLGRHDEAKEARQTARVGFKNLGAEADTQKLDQLFSEAHVQ